MIAENENRIFESEFTELKNMEFKWHASMVKMDADIRVMEFTFDIKYQKMLKSFKHKEKKKTKFQTPFGECVGP